MWIGIPLDGLWLAGELLQRGAGLPVCALGGIPLAMTASAWLLPGERPLRAQPRALQAGPGSIGLTSSPSDERSHVRRARAPRPLIDVAMTVSATTALILMAIWFFFFSQMWLVNPSVNGSAPAP